MPNLSPAEVLAVMEDMRLLARPHMLTEDYEKYRRAYTAIERAFSELEARQWRGMESAPKDGTEVLLHKEGRRYVARWIHSEAMGPVWATPDGHVIFRATEWTTLPTPPQEPV